MSSTPNTGGRQGRIIVIGVMAVLLVGMLFFMFKYLGQQGETEEAETRIEGMDLEIQDLEEDLKDYQTELENSDIELEEKEELLKEKEILLADKQKRINRLLKQNKISKEQAATLTEKVAQLEYYIKKYQKEITDLKGQVASLTADKAALEGKIDTITGKMTTLALAKNRAEVKLETAGQLRAIKFQYYRIKRSGKLDEDTEFRRGKLKDFRICFNILDNVAAESETKDIFLQILDPSGKVLKGDGMQSGYFTYRDEETAYTLKKSIEYDKYASQGVCMDFKKPEDLDLEKGNHKVMVYADGINIANSAFKVK